jgi:hypothetical protein
VTIPDLIDSVIGVIGRQFYTDCSIREFMRDRRHLMKAISRYGHECCRRGWDFDAPFIEKELLKILNEIKRTSPDIRWFPNYLEGAVDRSIRQRAEELSARAKTIQPKIAKIIEGARPVAVIEKTDTEVLSAVYRDLKRKTKRRGAAPAKQEALL